MPPQREANTPAVAPSYLDPLAAPSPSSDDIQACDITPHEYNTIIVVDDADSHGSSARRPMIQKHKSFIVEFVEKEGPRQIIVLMLLLALAFGSIIGVVPAVMTDRYARLNHGYTDPKGCTEWGIDEIKPAECLAGSGDAQNAAAIENLISNLLTFITSSLVGSISDERGRRDIIILGLTLSCISPFCLVLMQLIPTMSPTWYYVASGSTGLVNWIAVALSALADVLSPKFRAPGFGLLLASFSLGFALSPMLGAIFNHIQVSVVCCSILTVAWLSTVCCLPETLPPEAAAEAARVRAAQQAVDPTLWETTWNILIRPFRELSILNRNNLFRLLSALAFFSGMVGTADRTLLLYYVEEQLSFNEHDVAIMFMLSGILGILVQGVLIKPFNECFGERYVIVIAFVFGAVQNFLVGIARNKLTIFISTVVASFCGMSFPTISSIKSMNVKESEQGRIQGALFSVQALAAGAGPMVLRAIYHYTKDETPGAMFIAAAGLYLVAAGFGWALPPEKANSSARLSRRDYEELDDEVEQGTPDIHRPLL
ncbi:major facilitator superfamily-like protein [Fragilaria crotonensis]|nr:major facilitator superfamily-like protein [Fragilaria crotonensis]